MTANRRDAELAAIDNFIAQRVGGIKRCPPAFAAPSTQAALSAGEVADRLTAFSPKWQASLPEVITFLRKNGHPDAWSSGKDFKLEIGRAHV